MADTIPTLVAEVRDIVDVTDAQALLALSRRHKTMVSRSRCLRRKIDVGDTVDGQEFYEIDPALGVIEVLGAKIGGIPYARGRRDDAYADAQGRLVLSGDGGLIFVDADTSSNMGLTLIPSPDAGLEILLYAAILPADLPSTGNAAEVLAVDQDMYDVLVEAAAATWMKRQGEGDWQTPEAQFEAKCEELRQRVDRRLRGQGPPQIRIVGINA